MARPGDLSPYYNVTGISDDSYGATADYDGDGFSYSEQALTAAGLAPGASVTSGGLIYTWPTCRRPAGRHRVRRPDHPADNARRGDLDRVPRQRGQCGQRGASGTVTVTYTDGTTSTATLGMTDWTLGGGSARRSSAT